MSPQRSVPRRRNGRDGGWQNEMRESVERAFKVYGRPIAMVTSFKYLGRVLTAEYDYCPLVVGTLLKARKIWARMAIMLGREGISPRVSGMFFKAAVQEVLLFGSEMWVMTPPHGEGPSKFQEQGHQTDYREAS